MRTRGFHHRFGSLSAVKCQLAGDGIAIHPDDQDVRTGVPADGRGRIGDLPAELNRTIVYATSLTTMAKQPEAAKALVNHLALQSSAAAIRKNGMEPVGN